jgi:hypothetical protein
MVANAAKRTGRPAVLTPEVTESIVNALKAGAYIETAVVFAGISKSTFYRWMQRGEREKSGLHASFRDAIKKGLAFAEMRLLLFIGEAGLSQWQAAAWVLERRWPTKFARRTLPLGSHPTATRPVTGAKRVVLGNRMDGTRPVSDGDRAGA